MRFHTIDLARQTASEPPIGRLSRAILAGFAATVAMLLAFLVAYNLARLVSGALPVGVPGFGVGRVWLHNLTHNHLIDAGRADVYVATAVYVLGGLAWATIYGLLAEPRLRGPSWARGVTFSLVPAILSIVVLLPLVGGGLLGSTLGAGPLPAIGNLLLHLVYGVVLGHLYGPFGDLDAATLRGQDNVSLAAQLAGDLATVRGLLAGLAAGSAVGLTIAGLAGVDRGGTLLGQPVAALVLACAVLGMGLGSVAGSFLGLVDRGERSGTP